MDGDGNVVLDPETGLPVMVTETKEVPHFEGTVSATYAYDCPACGKTYYTGDSAHLSGSGATVMLTCDREDCQNEGTAG